MKSKTNAIRTASSLESEIQKRLRSLPDQRAATLRTFRRELSKQLAREAPAVIIELALKLVSRGGTNHRFIASELIQYHKRAFQALNSRVVEDLSCGLDNWADVDIFACYISGPAWREGFITEWLIRRWTSSRDRWLRRASLVSTVPLNSKARGGHGDAIRTLRICNLLVNDNDDMVVKALSWALRELAKRDPDSVRDFLTSNEKKLAPRIIREVNNKLSTGLKNPRKAL